MTIHKGEESGLLSSLSAGIHTNVRTFIRSHIHNFFDSSADEVGTRGADGPKAQNTLVNLFSNTQNCIFILIRDLSFVVSFYCSDEMK